MIENGLVTAKDIDGVPFKLDLIPISNTKARSGILMTPKYITIHNTANSAVGANAVAHTKYVDNITEYRSWHFTVDDVQIFQELPINEVAWHAGDGDGDGNRKSIAIEICENKDGNYKKSEENAIKLIAYLLKALKLPLTAVVPHQKWSGKYCPHIILDQGWDKFIGRLSDYMSKTNTQQPTTQDVSSWAVDARNWAIKNGISDGTKPKDYATREELWTMLYRAYVLNK